MTDPYETLGVDKDATSKEINAAYKKKAKKAHPDQGGSAEEFQQLKNSAMVLLDPEKRKRFDEEGIVDDNTPNNIQAKAMENIANFFINSVDALETPQGMGIRMNDLDMVSGAVTYFRQQIQGAEAHITVIEKKIKSFDKMLKRLKTKRKNDVIRTMITSHMTTLKNATTGSKLQIKMCEAAILILKDYEFEQEVNPYQGGRLFIPGRGGGFFS